MSGLPKLQQSLHTPSAEAKEMLGMRLCVLHNLYFYNHLMEEIREAIEEHRYSAFKKAKLEGFLINDKK